MVYRIKGAVSFLRFPFVICSVSILVDTASSVNTIEGRLKFVHEPLLPKHNLGLGYELEG
jgi:hypothetical protein